MKTTATVPVRYTFPDGTHEDAELPRELDDFVERVARSEGITRTQVVQMAVRRLPLYREMGVAK